MNILATALSLANVPNYTNIQLYSNDQIQQQTQEGLERIPQLIHRPDHHD